MLPRLVLDTNVIVAALRSRRGASYAVLEQVGTGVFETVVTVPLVLEYEAVLNRSGLVPLSSGDIGAVLDYLCSVSIHQTIYYLWRPALTDPGDDMVLEAAVASESTHIVTHNLRDFAGAASFGIAVHSPREVLALLSL